MKKSTFATVSSRAMKVSPHNRMSIRSVSSSRTTTNNRPRMSNPSAHSSITRVSTRRKASTTTSVLSLSNMVNDSSRPGLRKFGDENRTTSKCARMRSFWYHFTTLLFSPLFLRHRNIFLFLLEIIIPALSALIIFAAFTAGSVWRHNRDFGKSESARTIKLPDISMDDATKSFRSLHTDDQQQVLIYYTPIDEFTSEVMRYALDIAGLSERNIVVRSGKGTRGAVGAKDTTELFERALFHKNERNSQRQCVGVVFDYDPKEVSNYTRVPYHINYAISEFDKSIASTADSHAFVPPVTSKNWKTPYLTSGFIGLQYAIEEAIIRLIIDRQKTVELVEIMQGGAGKRSINVNGRHLSIHDDTSDDNILSSNDIDEDGLLSLVADTLKEIEQEKKRRALIEDMDQPYDYAYDDDTPPVIKREIGSSLGSDVDGNDQRQRRTSVSGLPSPSIRSSKELPQRFLRPFIISHPGTEKFRELLPYVVTFTLVVSYSFMSFTTVRQIARENLTGMKDLLQIHGLPHYIHWTLLFFHAVLFRAISAALVLWTMRINYHGHEKITKVVSSDILFVLLYLHQLSLTFMNYFFGSFIQSLRFCGLVAVTSCVLSFYLPSLFAEMKLIGSVSDFILGILFPNWCFSHAIHTLLVHDNYDRDINWSTILESEYPSITTFSVGEGMIRLACMGSFYFFISVYIGTKSGSRLFSSPHNKWYNLRDWLKRTQRKDSMLKQQNADEDPESDFPKPPVYEDQQPEKECCVVIRNLSKQFGKHNVALESLNINIVHEEITVFLGHSGCGKSTLISILAGVISPSDGHAVLNGFDVCLHPEKAREFIGVCPQKLVAFNLLTVREHIHLCYKLRGYNSKNCNRYAASILTQLKLWNVRSFLVNRISADELRRLGIAMAMVDSPKILLLDEPTRGMDAVGKRDVWDVLLAMRSNHTIIVTTNYMDEAEHLADRIALLAHGRLVCCGTLGFLKNQYDTGYFLKLVPYPSMFIDANAVINFVRRILGSKVYVKRHKRLKDVDTLELELPTKEKDHFADFCDELDQQKDALHIMKYSIRQVSLNDIFIKICTSVSAGGYAVDLYVRRDSAGDIKTVLTSEIPQIPEGTKKAVTRFHHIVALIKRSWTVVKANRQSFTLHFLVPLIVIFLVVNQAKLFIQSKDESPETTLAQSRYANVRTLSQVKDDDPFINYTSHISRVLSPLHEEVAKDDHIITKLYERMDAEREKLGYVKNQPIVAYELGRKRRGFQFVGYYASGMLHSAPIALNTMNNVLLSAISENERNLSTNWQPYQVTVKNDPMPSVKEEGDFENSCGTTCILLALLMAYSLAFICHTCCVLPLAERELGIKHLILMCGVEPATYWISHVVVDVFCMIATSLTIVLIFLSDLNHTFAEAEVMFVIWLICALYLVWSGLLFCYYIANIIPTDSNGYNVLAVVHLILGVVPFLWMVMSKTDSKFWIFVNFVMTIFLPPYTINSVLFHFFSSAGQRHTCRNTDSFIQWICDPDGDLTRLNASVNTFDALKIDQKSMRCCERLCKPDNCFTPPKVLNVAAMTWEDPGIIMDLCALFLQGFIFWGLLILVERRTFYKCAHNFLLKLCQPPARLERRSSIVEEDLKKSRYIRNESALVEAALKETIWPDDLALVCQKLGRSSTSSILIKNFDLEVKKGQCVALLGRGNSGKSCIVRMIAGELIPTEGNCFLQDAKLVGNRRAYLSRVGYSPQKSCLFTYFTGAEMLELMGRMRGIPSSILGTHVNKWLSVMGLVEVANDLCAEYGEGIKQRLCTAMALIGEPEIIVLDEPTTGVDPVARERLWCVLEHLNQKGFTTIFTTYSTDEAFALADKVVVLSENTVQCIGKPEDVKNTYARGHTVSFKLKSDLFSSAETMSIMEVMATEFKEHVVEVYNKHVDLLDEHDELLMFFIRDTRLSWAEIFRRGHYLASVHEELIASYEVTEGVVDDIFIFLANKQELTKPHQHTEEYDFRRSFIENEIDEMEELRKAGERYRRSKF